MGNGPSPSPPNTTGSEQTRRLYFYNGGFLTQTRVRRIMELAGYSLHMGRPGEGDAIAVWGASPTAHRGANAAERHDVPVVTVEDAFLRSLHPGREGEPPLGLLIDTRGPHFDPSQPSDLETLITENPLDDAALLNRARGCMARLQEAHLSKYAATLPDAPVPDPGYVLVIDQTQGDASVTASGADRSRFLEMLTYARQDHPRAPIYIKAHPETRAGHRPGYFEESDAQGNVQFLDSDASPFALLEGAIAVYTVSSHFGFEAIMMGHRPILFGQPFYAGWGLSDDRFEITRRQRNLTRAQLFAAAMLLYPVWYDPFRDQLCNAETAIDTLDATARAWREDHRGWTAGNIRLWKRPHMQRFFGQQRPLRFTNTTRNDIPHMIWGSGDADARVEDGFLRSRGLGAELVPPLSLVMDQSGIYYDATMPSDLEALIAARAELRPDQQHRAERLITTLTREGLSKYNLAGDLPDLPEGHRILVPGQVEDDASIRLGTGDVATNAALLKAARDANPDAVILYKPHPDVTAGLRPGALSDPTEADLVLDHVDIAALLGTVNEVWTMTSLTGFEALLRGVPVTTLGAPFYAGWGLTRDLGDIPPRRRAAPTLEGLVHAALIDYPRYLDPKTGQPCPVEVIVDRLAGGYAPKRGVLNRMGAKLQGIFASQAHLWRRG